MPRIRISKIESAEYQLKEVIRLFFEDRDPLSIHTLAFAIHNVLNDILHKAGGAKFLQETSMIVPGKEEEYKKILRKAGNFLKHADKDSEETLDFDPSLNEFFILDCCMIHDQLPRPRLKEATVFKIWFYLKHPNMITGPITQIAQSMGHLTNKSNLDLFRELLNNLHIVPDIPVAVLDSPPKFH